MLSARALALALALATLFVAQGSAAPVAASSTAAISSCLEVRLRPDAPFDGDLVVDVGASATTASMPLFITLPDGGASAGVKLVANAGDTTIAVTTDLPGDFEPGKQRLAMLSASGVSSDGVRNGSLVAVINGAPCYVRGLQVRRSSQEVVIAGSGASGVDVSTESTAFRYDLQLQSLTPRPISDLDVVVSPLHADGVAQVVPSVRVTDPSGTVVRLPGPLPGNATLSLTLTADLPIAGTYSGTVRLAYDGLARAPVALKVVRNRVAPSISADPIGAVDAAPGAAATLTVTFKETRGTVVHVSSVEAFAVDRKLTGATRRVGAPTVTVDSPNAKPGEFDIGPGGGHVTLHVSGLPEPGEYAGQLRFVTKDGLPTETAFSVLVRRSRAVAFWLLLSGILLAVALRWAVTTLTTKLELRRRAADLRGAFPAVDDAAPDVVALVASLSDRLKPFEDLTRGVPPKATETVDDLERRVSILVPWVALRRAVDAPGASLTRPPELEAVREALSASSVDAATASALAAQVTVAEHKVSLQLRYTAPKVELTEAADQWTAGHPDRPTGMAPVMTALGKLDDAIVAGDETAASAALDAAKRGYVVALADDLLTRMDQSEPLGVTPAAWAAVQVNVEGEVGLVRTALSGAEAEKLYDDAYAEMATASLDGLSSEVSSRRAPTLPADGARRLDQADALITAMRAAVGLRRFRTFPADYSRAVDLVKGVPSSNGADAGPGLVSPPMVQPRPATPVAPAPPASRVLAVHSRAVPWVTSTAVKLVLGLVLGILAAVAGLTLLYEPNAVWGSVPDMITAFFWGFAAQGAGGTGLEWLTSLMGKAKAPAG